MPSLQVYRTLRSSPECGLCDARIIAGVRKNNRITPTLRDELHWLSVTQDIMFKLCLTVCKALHGISPSYIAELCRPVASAHYRPRLRSATCGDLLVPRTRLERGKTAFVLAGQTAWNILPLSVRLPLSTTTFKTALKTHLCIDASKYQWLADAFMMTICFCKAPLRCWNLRRFINSQYWTLGCLFLVNIKYLSA